MGTHIQASESPSGEGAKNVPRSDTSPVKDPKCLHTSLNFFYINFCNIRSLRSNFQSVEHHLFSTKPPHLFLTKTQLSGAIDSSPFSVPSYFPYSSFQSKAGCCVYVHNDSFLYLVLFLQSLHRIPQSKGAPGTLPLPAGGPE
ncbi:hypothetical protein E2C01_070128 [Portunus trituberculatus]|uniref:Uncharacterized protein n=1 Tax=Portunus trituberculatus TaxID=210409 RepID=A0A5B7I4L7_PORTR|nr:hypothetical protein [Portunus trituberculatus]